MLTVTHMADPGCPWAYSALPSGLTTREVSTVLAGHDQAPDDDSATAALLELVGRGEASRVPLGVNAVWRAS